MDEEVRRIAVPPRARGNGTLARIDYEDAFLVAFDDPGARTGEQWARAILADTSPALRQTLLSGWAALGLELAAADAPEAVLGWTVRRSTPELALLGAGSRAGTHGELLFERRRRTLLFATFVQLDGSDARAAWARIERSHAEIVRRVLAHAQRRLASDLPTAGDPDHRS